MAIGRKSITDKLSFTVGETKHEFIVQINRNGGICDIQPRVGEVFSDFQGRPYELAASELINALYTSVNKD